MYMGLVDTSTIPSVFAGGVKGEGGLDFFGLLSRLMFRMMFGILKGILPGELSEYCLGLQILFAVLFRIHQEGCNTTCLQVVLNLTNTFDSSFSRWTVGLGIEHQLNELRVAAGLEEEARFRTRARNLDYTQLVQPEVAVTK